MTPEQREWLKRPTVLPPTLQQIEGTKRWKFVEEYRISLPPPNFPLRLVIPAGWQYDRSSIPEAIPSWLVSKDDLGSVAPAAHDAGCQCHGRFPQILFSTLPYIVDEADRPTALTVDRAAVDEWFLMYLLRQRVPRWRATIAWWAVRLGGMFCGW